MSDSDDTSEYCMFNVLIVKLRYKSVKTKRKKYIEISETVFATREQSVSPFTFTPIRSYFSFDEAMDIANSLK